MGRVVEREPDGHDEDHGGDDLDGESAKVGVAGDVGDGEGDAEDDDERHADVGQQDEGDDSDDAESQGHVADQLTQNELKVDLQGSYSVLFCPLFLIRTLKIKNVLLSPYKDSCLSSSFLICHKSGIFREFRYLLH